MVERKNCVPALLVGFHRQGRDTRPIRDLLADLVAGEVPGVLGFERDPHLPLDELEHLRSVAGDAQLALDAPLANLPLHLGVMLAPEYIPAQVESGWCYRFHSSLTE